MHEQCVWSVDVGVAGLMKTDIANTHTHVTVSTWLYSSNDKNNIVPLGFQAEPDQAKTAVEYWSGCTREKSGAFKFKHQFQRRHRKRVSSERNSPERVSSKPDSPRAGPAPRAADLAAVHE